MGWAYGENAEGREIGYGVEAECDEPECSTRIDRGMDYACGGEHRLGLGDERGCGGYFCYSHLFFAMPPDHRGQLCARCIATVAEEDELERDEAPR